MARKLVIINEIRSPQSGGRKNATRVKAENLERKVFKVLGNKNNYYEIIIFIFITKLLLKLYLVYIKFALNVMRLFQT